jgi:putative transposase
MRKIDELYTNYPFYGCRKMAAILEIDKDHANRLMRKMGIEAIYQKPRLSVPNADHEIFHYVLRNVKIEKVDQVWSTDITYIPMAKWFVYLIVYSFFVSLMIVI